ncbi:MAG: hypothetical protein ACP5HH_07360 [Fervidicoccaceae archaeon]
MEKIEQAEKEKVKVYFDLIGNPRATRGNGWVALIQGDNIQFLRASIPQFDKNTLIGGTYLLPVHSFVIVKSDTSSHKNSRQHYTLYFIVGEKEEKIRQIANISIINNNISFSPAELENIYLTAPPEAKSKVIYTLVQYAKTYIATTQLLTP